MKKLLLIVLVTISALGGSMQLKAQQCKIQNTVFQDGEELYYDLYFKYGLLNTKAGYSTLNTTHTTYGGKQAYQMTLRGQSTGAVEKLFYLDDTLTSYMTKDLVPLAFRKRALEGKDYTREDITYTYKGSAISIQAKRVKNGAHRFDETISASACTYDMVSVVFYARTLDYSKMKQGDKAKIQFMSGRRKVNMEIEHQGFERMKANNDKKYRCIKLSLSISDDAFENKEEAMKVYITDDKNRVPVRMDSKLKVGSTRAVLKSYKGLRHVTQ